VVKGRKSEMGVFDREYALAYDNLYQDKDYTKECDFIEEIFQKFSVDVKRVLDLGCGTGEHALILAKRGYQMMGVDRSQDMLEIAIKKAEKAGLSVKFTTGDVTNIKLQSSFDAVVSMFAVMSYQTSNTAFASACKTAANHLRCGGIFIFDCWYGPAVITERPTVRIKEVTLNDSEKIIRLTEPTLDSFTHTVKTCFTLLKIKGEHLINETKESHFMRFFFPQEVKYLLHGICIFIKRKLLE
jgi:SAM-dependent methyltransferase